MLKEKYTVRLQDCDDTACMGLKGYMYLFQESVATFMHLLDLDNETVRSRYGICWIFTKYRFRIYREAEYGKELVVFTWKEKEKRDALCHMGFRVECGGEVYGEGRLQCCLMDINTGELRRMSAIGYPPEEADDIKADVPPFTRSFPPAEELSEDYTRNVRYTDLDNNHHMNNLKYTEMFINAADAEFYGKNRIAEFEIRYLSQCFEKERVHVLSGPDGDTLYLAAVHEDGTAAAEGYIRTLARV